MNMKQIIGLAAGVGAALVAATAPVSFAAAQDAPAITLDQVLQRMREERRSVSAENRQREQQFLAERNRQRALVQQVRQQITEQETLSTQLEAEFNENDRRIGELTEQFEERQGEFSELFGAARTSANELAAQVERSLVSAEFPGRAEPLREIAQTKKLPSAEQLELLWETLLEEGAEQAKVSRFNATVYTDAGDSEEISAVRIGPFTAFSGNDYLVFNDETGRLEFLARQPQIAGARDSAARVFNYSGDGVVRGVIDPSLGQLLSLVVDAPTWRERVDQGGPIGYAVIGALALGMLVGLYKLVTLNLTQAAVRGQARKKKPSKGNPLGRIMLAYEANQNADSETLQLKLDDAVLKELPKLEGGLNLVKVLAAVAPLMGLLGTVTGMIRTFQAITLFGTGDPKLMAGGISEALVTTMLGLIAAIPLLLLHAFASGASRRTAQILEEQAVGLVADRAER
ncbi:MAG: MotA/TolQ/ExbB proton channel family protein [Pseudomonadota bacterium]